MSFVANLQSRGDKPFWQNCKKNVLIKSTVSEHRPGRASAKKFSKSRRETVSTLSNYRLFIGS